MSQYVAWIHSVCNTPFLYPTHTIISKVPQSNSEFRVQIQPQRPGRFSIASQRRARIGRWVKNYYPFEHGEVINYALDGESIHPVTTKIQAPYLTQLPESKETMSSMVTLKQVQS